jgi:hypothetical protein
MRKKLVLGTIMTLSLITLVLAATVNTALAVITKTEHMKAAGTSIIDVPGHPKILIVAQHMGQSDFYKGDADRINLFVVFTTPTGGTGLRLVSAYEDNPERWAFSQQVGGGPPGTRPLVEKGQIQIFRICKVVFVYWKIPLVMPATSAAGPLPATPEITLPPGLLVFRGYGDAESSGGVANFPSGWKSTTETTGYDAKATLFCPDWHYWGPAAEADSAAILTEGTNIWTHP